MAVLVGLFAYYRDAAEALGALEALGLAPGNGHLYQKAGMARESLLALNR